ncbi:MAG: hypothetical protein R3330_02830 [Saprospiraceae bacterium]|nr:hypothetical protein [Saprospiraceae bacterium]
MAKVDIAVVQEEKDAFSGLCSCSFRTDFWPTEKIATERIKQHFNEHETGELMDSLQVFREKHGLVVSTEDGRRAVFPESAKVVTPKTSKSKKESD